MPDYTPNFIPQIGETIGDSGSSDYNLTLTPARLPNRNAWTKIASNAIIYTLEFFLTIVLLPFTTCKRIYENQHLMTMLQVIVEVSLELTMWLVLAGVSVLTSAALIFDDLYCGKSGSEGYRRLVKKDVNSGARGESQDPSSIEDSKLSTDNEWHEEMVVGSSRSSNRDWLSCPYPVKNELQMPDSISKRMSHTPEVQKTNSTACASSVRRSPPPQKDDDSVNFSFYKPLRHGLISPTTGNKQRI